MEQICPSCKNPVTPEEYFCPNCGKKLKEPPVKITIGRVIWIILLSTLAPPLGLFPGIRYFRQKDQNVKILGMTAIVLTIISIIVTTWYTTVLIGNINKSINSQLNQLNFENPSGL